MDLNMFALMYSEGLIDGNLNNIPDCPICDRLLVKTRDSVYSYYCDNCKKSAFLKEIIKNHNKKGYLISFLF